MEKLKQNKEKRLVKEFVMKLHRKNINTEMEKRYSFLWVCDGVMGKGISDGRLQEQLITFDGEIIKEIYFGDLRTITLIEDVKLISCSYYLLYEGHISKKIKYKYHIIILVIKDAEIGYVQIHKVYDESKTYNIRASNENRYRLNEEEILYIESMHNKVVWHCFDKTIVCSDSLHNLEEKMSENFVRIQRGYLVNKNRVCCVRRCEVEMDNGDVLSIPTKKYIHMREKLLDK